MKECITRAEQHNAIKKEDAAWMKAKFDDLVASGRAPAEAKAEIITLLQNVAKEKEKRALLTEDIRIALEKRIYGHKNRKGEQDIAGGWFAVMSNMENEKSVVLSRWLRDANEMMLFFQKGLITGDKRRQSQRFGNEDVQTTMFNMVRELRGEKTGDAKAAEFAATMRDAFDKARQEFNALGGSIGKLEDWFPQSHNADEVRRLGRTKWVEYHLQPGVLDREKMISHLTGNKLTDKELKEGLEHAFESITQAGWNTREITSTPVGKGALYKQHADHRFLHYASADAWLNYAKQYGNPDPWNAALAHLDVMARDVAAMKVFGPNPDVIRNYMRNTITKHIETTASVNVIHAEQKAEMDALYQTAFGGVQLEGRALDMVKVYQEKIQWLSDRIEQLRRNGGNYDGMDTSSKEMRAAITELQGTWQKLRDRDAITSDFGRMPDADLNTPERIAAKERMQEILDDWREQIFTPEGNWQGKARQALNDTDQMWDAYRGLYGIAQNQNIADAFGAARNLKVSSALGSAIVSALTDNGFNTMARAFIGMDKRGIKTLISDIVAMSSKENKAEAIRAQLMFSHMLHNTQQNARWAIAQSSVAGTGYLAERTMALSGLTAWTENAKAAFGLDFFGFMADRSQTKFTDLPGEVRMMLERNRITEPEWDKIRLAEQHKGRWDSSGIIRPREVEAVGGQELADKYLLMMLNERLYAVMEPTLYVRSKLAAGTQRGTWAGEFLRSALQFKSFGLTLMHLHYGRIADEAAAGRSGSAARYVFSMITYGIVLGAVVLQLKELIAGRDPRPMDSLGFWGAAFIQSGGAGIYGDFLNSSQNRFGGGLTSTLAGPLAGEAEKLLALTAGNVGQLYRGEKTNFGSEMVNTVGRNVPVLPSLLYTRAAYQRMFLDQLHRTLDPEGYSAVVRRQVANRKKDYGNEMFWSPGEVLPGRLPNLGSVVRER